MRPFGLASRRLSESYQCAHMSEGKASRRGSQAPCRGVQCQDKRQRAPAETQEAPPHHPQTLFSLGGGASTGTGCPGRLWHLRPWRRAEVVGTWRWAAGSGCPCLRGQHEKMPCKGSRHDNEAVIFVILRLRERSEEHGVCWAVVGVRRGRGRGSGRGKGR